ncbi:MAG: hypothetical protein IPL86_18685 [Flavobacteriales bacterium]|nr:hypothetical protein [Flavobacteriales bacterium]
MTGTAPCANASATVTVNGNGSPNAGTDGAITLCSNGPLTDLFAQLGGSPDGGGSWSGGILGGILDPSTLAAGPHTFTYTLTATAPCTGDNADVVVNIAAPPVAGTAASITVCDQGAAVNMLTALGTADPGGAWAGPSTVVGNMYDPTTMNGGAYVYTVTGTAPCANASATVTVTETGSPNAGTDGAITLCSNGALRTFSRSSAEALMAAEHGAVELLAGSSILQRSLLDRTPLLTRFLQQRLAPAIMPTLSSPSLRRPLPERMQA